MLTVILLSAAFLGFALFGYVQGRQEGYERGYSDAWWRGRGEPTMSEYARLEKETDT